MSANRSGKPSVFRNQSGFTLVELLVVIGIIALLISILLPSLSRARKAAVAVACASNLRQVGLAWTAYQTENQNWIVPAQRPFNNSGWGGDYWTNSGNVVTNAHWYNYLVAGGYVTYKVLNCPGLTYVTKPWAVEASSTEVRSESTPNYSYGGATFTLPAGMAVGDGWGRYVCNYAYPRDTFGTSEKDSSPSFFAQYPARGPKKMTGANGLLKLHAQAVAQDAASAAPHGGMDPSNIIVACDGTAYLVNGAYDTAAHGGLLDLYRWAHGSNDRMNVLFLDGHVASVGRGDVFAVYVGPGPNVYYAR